MSEVSSENEIEGVPVWEEDEDEEVMDEDEKEVEESEDKNDFVGSNMEVDAGLNEADGKAEDLKGSCKVKIGEKFKLSGVLLKSM